MKKRLALLLSLLLLLTGCWQEDTAVEDSALTPMETEAPAEKLSLPQTFALPYLPGQTFDPITCPDGIQQTVGALLYEGLFQLDQQFVAQPRLCARYSYHAATLTYTLALREAVAFSDGSELTATDVVATLRRAMVSTRYAARLSNIAAVDGAGHTVTILLKTDSTALPALLDIPIIKAGTEQATVPPGTGAYLCVTDSEGLHLLANSGWWGKGTAPVARIELVAAKDADALLYRFTSHEVQLLAADLTGTTPISTTGNIDFTNVDTTVLQYIGCNTRKPLLADAALRRALQLGVNRRVAVRAFLSGHGQPAQFPISPVSPLYPAQLETPYSAQRFEEAIRAAGLDTGTTRRLTLLVNSENPFKVAVAKSIAASLSVCDLRIEVREKPWEDYLRALHAGDFDLYYGEVRLTADWSLQRLLGTGGSLNYGGYADPTMDQMLAEWNAASDRKAGALRLGRYLQQQQPILPVCFKSACVLTQESVVEHLSPTAADPFFGLENWTIHLAGTE
ncbi:MAG: ABC transporter substrate-binding protein, partial [Oscillospiraceae bacterium]